MGSGCCTRSAFRIHAETPIEEDSNTAPLNLSAQLQQARKRKSILYQRDTSESTFTDLASPRSGKIIKWKRGKIIGQGTYAKVYQCMNVETGELLAVKHFRLSDDPKKIDREFISLKNEISLLKELNHPNIVQYYQAKLSKDMTSIDVILEYISGGSLITILQEYDFLEEEVIKNYGKQIVRGLVYLHEHGIIHRDLKSANVLVTASGIVKLTDFGASKKFLENGGKLLKSLIGSPYWMAPEVALREGHSYSADIWSLGCVLIEMSSGQPPWSNYSKDAKEVIKLISTPNKYPIIPKCSRSLESLIHMCLQRDPFLRPTAKQVLEHEFFVEKLNEDS